LVLPVAFMRQLFPMEAPSGGREAMSVDVSEFQTRLKKQGLMLCFPVGKSLNAALQHFGFQADQEVVMRFGWGRLEILPRTSTEAARDQMLSAAGELRSLRKRMQVIAETFSEVTDEELEKEETLEAELLGLLECLLADDLDPAIEKLESVAVLRAAKPFQGE
jgi:hypothetical protein